MYVYHTFVRLKFLLPFLVASATPLKTSFNSPVVGVGQKANAAVVKDATDLGGHIAADR